MLCFVWFLCLRRTYVFLVVTWFSLLRLLSVVATHFSHFLPVPRFALLSLLSVLTTNLSRFLPVPRFALLRLLSVLATNFSLFACSSLLSASYAFCARYELLAGCPCFTV